MRRMRAGRLTVALMIMFSMMFGAVQGVSAHSVYEDNWTHYDNTGGMCAWGRSEISHGTGGGGYVRVDVEAWNGSWWGGACNNPVWKAAYGLRAKYTTIKYNDATGEWDWCVNSDWSYNWDERQHFQIQAWLGEYEPPCGHGYYGNWGGAYVATNGTWVGDYILAWQHWLP